MKRVWRLGAFALVALIIGSCAGAPKPQDEPAAPAAAAPTVASVGRPEAEAARRAADEARAKADAERASVAAKDEYAAAQAAYAQADAELSAGRYAEAAEAYKRSEDGYLNAAKLTAERRAAALAAMRRADASLQATDERLKAIETEIGTEGGAP